MNEIKVYYDYFLTSTLSYENIKIDFLELFIKEILKKPNQLSIIEKDKLLKKIYSYDISQNYRLQLLEYAINYANEESKLKFLGFYYFNNPTQMFENIEILKYFYVDVKSFIKDFKFIFNDEYFKQTVMYQKAMIYYFYFMTTDIYERSSDHKYFFKVLYKVFKRFLKEKMMSLFIFYMYH